MKSYFENHIFYLSKFHILWPKTYSGFKDALVAFSLLMSFRGNKSVSTHVISNFIMGFHQIFSFNPDLWCIFGCGCRVLILQVPQMVKVLHGLHYVITTC